MTEQEIKELLNEIVYMNKIQISAEMLAGLARTLHTTTNQRARPMPPAALIKNSAEFKTFLDLTIRNISRGMDQDIQSFKPDMNNVARDAAFRKATEFVSANPNCNLVEVTESLAKEAQILGLKKRLQANSNSQEEYLRYITGEQQKYHKALTPPNEYDYAYKAFEKGDYVKQLMKLSLSVFSDFCTESLKKPDGPAYLIHFYENLSHPRSSEYLEPYDSDEDRQNHTFDRTSHGLGSAVYGVASVEGIELSRQIDDMSRYEIVKIENPLRLNQHESNEYTSVSKWMQRVANDVAQLQKMTCQTSEKLSRKEALQQVLLGDKRKNELTTHATSLSDFEANKKSSAEMKAILVDSLNEFVTASKSSQSEYVAMPINFVMKRLGYTGVVSQSNNRFNRGLVAFEATTPDISKWDKTIVKSAMIDRPFPIVGVGDGGLPLDPTSISTSATSSTQTALKSLYSDIQRKRNNDKRNNERPGEIINEEPKAKRTKSDDEFKP